MTCISISFDCQIAAFGTCDGSLGILDLTNSSKRVRVRQVWREIQDFAITSIVVDHGANNLFASSANGTLTWLSIGEQSKGAFRRKEFLLIAFLGAIVMLLVALYKFVLP